ncbi:hypothetical protein C5S36_10055 [Candidatus Methanophagaceae archaeon]|nr:hypothetical protein C5S36_10055 [Methanophagales archaeon]
MKQKYKRINAIAPVVLVSVLVLLGAFTVVNAQGQDSSGKLAFDDKEDPLLYAIEEDPLLYDAPGYAADTGVSIDEALHRFQLQDIAGELGAELTTNETETFAGLWIVHIPEFRVVVQFTRDGEETIKPYLKRHTELANIVEVRTANVSLADLRRAHADATYSVSALDIPVESGISVSNNSVELYVLKADRSRFDDALQRREIRLSDKVRVITVEELSVEELEKEATEEYMESGRDIDKPNPIATYGTLPEFETKEQWRKWSDEDCGVIIEGAGDKIDPYFYPAGPLVSCGTNFEGYIVMKISKNLTVEKPLLDEIYGIIDEEAKKNGIYEVPVRFVLGDLYQPDILVEDSTDDVPPSDETSSKSVPGFGLLGVLISFAGGWLFRRKQA